MRSRHHRRFCPPRYAVPTTGLRGFSWLRCLVLACLRHALRQRLVLRAERSFDCFAEPAPDEICVGDRKLAGSAQRRIDGALLQHGSIRLRPDPASAVQGTGLAGAGATSLAEIAQGPISESALRSALQESFEDLLEQPLRPGELSADERALALGRECLPRQVL